MVNSMTGFATLKGEIPGWSWTWDMRSVNARGLDLRLRLPDWLDGLDQPVRAALGKALARGNVTLGLKLSRDAGTQDATVDPNALDQLLTQLKAVEDAAKGAGVTLATPSTMDVLTQKGVLSAETTEDDPAPLVQAIIAQMPDLLTSFKQMRQAEGEALAEVLQNQLSEIERLTKDAAAAAEDRRDQWQAKLAENLARAMENTDGADPDRVAQEIAVIVVKADVTEEIDRLHAHVATARELLTSGQPVGRKLDFLSQEFNREANTLCSKAQSKDLTRIGLDLKATIDQMREQVQNVE